MKYCQKCGNELDDDAVICPKCGCAVPGNSVHSGEKDEKSTAYAVLGFFIPVVGLIMFIIWHDEMPLRAKSAGKGALIGVIVYVAVVVFCLVLYMILFGSLFGGFLWNLYSGI